MGVVVAAVVVDTESSNTLFLVRAHIVLIFTSLNYKKRIQLEFCRTYFGNVALYISQ